MPPSLLRFPSRLHRRLRRSRFQTMLFLILTILTILTPLYWIYKPPSFLISYLSSRNPSVLFHISTTSPLIALTIDDTPSSHTPEILSILAENKIHATFFVIGAQVAGREDVLKSIVAQGHELGNHAMHDEPSRSLPSAILSAQIQDVSDLIATAYDSVSTTSEPRKPPRYFRPGSGFFNQRLLNVVEGMGYRVVLGDVYPHDPQVPYWRVNARHVLSMVRKGSVVICHDRRSWTAPMLRRVLPELRARGYRVGSLSEVLDEAKEGG